MARTVTNLSSQLHQMYPLISKPTRSVIFADIEEMAKKIKNTPPPAPPPMFVTPQLYEDLKAYMAEATPKKEPVATTTRYALPPQVTSDLVQVMQKSLTVRGLLERLSRRERTMSLSPLTQLTSTQMHWATKTWDDGSENSLLRPVFYQRNYQAGDLLVTLETTEERCTRALMEWQRIKTLWSTMFQSSEPIWVGSQTGRFQTGTGEAKSVAPSILRPRTVGTHEPNWLRRDGRHLKPLAIPSKQQCKLLPTVNSIFCEKAAEALQALTAEDVCDLLPNHLALVSASIRRKDRLKDALEAGEKVRRDSEQRQREFKRRYERASWYAE